MSARVTFERILRDDDDASGQSIRKWKIEAEAGHIWIRHNNGDGFVLLRTADIDALIVDLKRAQEAAQRLKAEEKQV